MEKKHTKKETVKIINKEKTKSNLIRLNACLKLQEALKFKTIDQDKDILTIRNASELCTWPAPEGRQHVSRVHRAFLGSRIQNPENCYLHVKMFTTATLNDCSCKSSAKPTTCHLTWPSDTGRRAKGLFLPDLCLAKTPPSPPGGESSPLFRGSFSWGRCSFTSMSRWEMMLHTPQGKNLFIKT